MKMNTRSRHGALYRAMAMMLARANAGTAPDRIDLAVVGQANADAGPTRGMGGRDTLFLTLDGNGRPEVTIGIATHWTILGHDRLRPALTPGGEIAFLGIERGRRTYFWIEDGRFHCGTGSPLLSAAQEEEAITAFSVELARLQAEVA